MIRTRSTLAVLVLVMAMAAHLTLAYFPDMDGTECPPGSGGFLCGCEDLEPDSAQHGTPPGATSVLQQPAENTIRVAGTVDVVESYTRDNYHIGVECESVDGAPCQFAVKRQYIRQMNHPASCRQDMVATVPAHYWVCDNIKRYPVSVQGGAMNLAACKVTQGWYADLGEITLGDDDMWGQPVTMPPEAMMTTTDFKLFVDGTYTVRPASSFVASSVAVSLAGVKHTITAGTPERNATFTTRTHYGLIFPASLKIASHPHDYDGVGEATITDVTTEQHEMAATLHAQGCSGSETCTVRILRMDVVADCEDAGALRDPVSVRHNFACSDDSSLDSSTCDQVVASKLYYDTSIAVQPPTGGATCESPPPPTLEVSMWLDEGAGAGTFVAGTTKLYRWKGRVHLSDSINDVVLARWMDTSVFMIDVPTDASASADTACAMSTGNLRMPITDVYGHATYQARLDFGVEVLPFVGTARELSASLQLGKQELKIIRDATATPEQRKNMQASKAMLLCFEATVGVDAAGRRRASGRLLASGRRLSKAEERRLLETMPSAVYTGMVMKMDIVRAPISMRLSGDHAAKMTIAAVRAQVEATVVATVRLSCLLWQNKHCLIR